MKTTNISDLVKGLLIIIGLAVSMGRFDDLKYERAFVSLKNLQFT